MRRLVLLIAAVVGCGAEDETVAAPPVCDPDALPDGQGGCVGPGIAPELCRAGFVADGASGCSAILPEAPCPAGTMAVPGQPSCEPVRACGAAWTGDEPVVHVAAAYQGTDSDGSAERPWTRIGDAVTAAPAGATVLVAEGLYEEALVLSGKPVSIVGDCPERVEIRGPWTSGAVVKVQAGAEGTVLRGVALTGARHGVGVDGAAAVTLEELWIHDTASGGVMVTEVSPASVVLRHSLIERAGANAVTVVGGELSVEASVLRDAAGSTEGDGIGILALPSLTMGTPARVTVVGSVIERCDDSGVLAICSEAHIEASVVRDHGGAGSRYSEFSAGAFAGACTDGIPAVLAVEGSVFERNVHAGIFSLGADLSVEATAVRDTRYDDDPDNTGLGIIAMRRDRPDQVASVRRSLVERSVTAGIGAFGAAIELEGVLVRDTAPSPVSGEGHGLSVYAWGEAVFINVRGSRFERSHETGVYLSAADAFLERVWVNDTFISGPYGMGVGIAARYLDESFQPTQLHLLDVTVSRSHGFGVYALNSHATLERVHVMDTAPSLSGVFGDGVAALFGLDEPQAPPSLVTLKGSTIERSARAGLANLGGDVIYADNQLLCNPIALNGETDIFNAEHHTYSFEDGGGNRCACGDVEAACEVVTSELGALPLPVKP